MSFAEIRTIADFSAREVARRLRSDNETENQKVDFLVKHFYFEDNITIDAANCLFEYYKNLHLSLELDYDHLLKLRQFFPPGVIRFRWTAFLQLALNRSRNLSTEQKVDLIYREFELGNRPILKGLSRDFLSSLTESEFKRFEPYYRSGDQKRYKAILEARKVAREPRSLTDSSGTIAEIREMKMPPTPSMLPATVIMPVSIRSAPSRATRLQEFKEAAPILFTCATIFAGIAAVGGFFLGGPVGAVVLGVAGFLVGTLIGFLGNALVSVIKTNLENKKAETPPASPALESPSDTPRASLERAKDSLAFLSNRIPINNPELRLG